MVIVSQKMTTKYLSIGIGIYVAQTCSFRIIKCTTGIKTSVQKNLANIKGLVGVGK